jgi:hypothetical protein
MKVMEGIWGTWWQLVEALHYKLRVRFPVGSLRFFIDFILLAALRWW